MMYHIPSKTKPEDFEILLGTIPACSQQELKDRQIVAYAVHVQIIGRKGLGPELVHWTHIFSPRGAQTGF